MTHHNGAALQAAYEEALIAKTLDRFRETERARRARVRIVGSAISEDELMRGYAHPLVQAALRKAVNG